MLPLKIDIGAVGVNTTRGYAPGIGAAVGVHWASLSPTPTDTDVGIGVFGALLSTPTDPSMMNSSSGVAYGGAYLEVGHTLARNDFARVWAAGRGEYLGSSAFGESHKGLGAMGRIQRGALHRWRRASNRAACSSARTRSASTSKPARATWSTTSARSKSARGLTFRTPLVLAP